MKLKFTRRFSAVSVVSFVFAFAFAAMAASAPVSVSSAAAPVHALGVGIDFSLAFSGGDANARAEDSIYREELGQDFSSLFDGMDDSDFTDIDTVFAWSNERINSGRFDYKTLGPEDTIKIALIDSAQNRFYVHPFPNYVTSRFGPRRYLWHYGTDVKLNTGDTLRVALDGIVRVIQFDRRGYGNVVVVRHHNGLETLYGHLHKVTVEPNQRIKAGDMVGFGGNTGRSTGAHLHFEFRYYGEPFSPEYIIDFNKYALKSDTLVLTKENFDYLTELRKTVYHSVRRGENLGSIARRYGTTVNNLCKLNGITSRTPLRVGRRLVVRSGKEAERQVASLQTDAADITPAEEIVSIPAADAVDINTNTENEAAPQSDAIDTAAPVEVMSVDAKSEQEMASVPSEVNAE